MKQANFFYYLLGSVIFIFSQIALASSIIDDTEAPELGERHTSCSDDQCSTYVYLGKGKMTYRSMPLEQIVFTIYSSQSLLCGGLDTNEVTLGCKETENTINCVKTVAGESGECLVEQLVQVKPSIIVGEKGEGEEEVQEYIRVVLSDASKREVFCNHASCVEVVRKAKKIQSFSDGINGYESIIPYTTKFEYMR